MESMGGLDSIVDKLPGHLRGRLPVDKAKFLDDSNLVE